MSNNVPRETVKIMVFGTFDSVHRGHLNFFKQARSLVANPFLVVSIARDKNVQKIKKKAPDFGEKERMLLVKASGLADKVVLAGLKEHLPHILKEKPDIIALGYDQRAYVSNLKNELKSRGLAVKIVRLRPYKKHIFKNHLLKQNVK